MNDGIKNEIKSVLLDELSAEFKIKELEPGDVTGEMMARETGLSRKWCVDLLERRVISGELTKYKIRNRHGSGFMYAYHKVNAIQDVR